MRWLALITIVTVPATFIMVYIFYVIEHAQWWNAFAHLKSKEANIYFDKALKLAATMGYFVILLNIFSCLIMALVLRKINLMTRAVKYGRDILE